MKRSDEYLEFLNHRSADKSGKLGHMPPGPLTHITRSMIHQNMVSEKRLLWARILGVQILSGLATLLVCPQFGIGPWIPGTNLMHWFMNLGTIGCPLACGSFFAAASLIFFPILLERGELRFLLQKRLLVFLLTSLASIALLMSAGAALQTTDVEHSSHAPDLFFSIFWLLGAWFFSVVATPMTLYNYAYEK